MRTVMGGLLCTAGLRVRTEGPGNNAYIRTLSTSSSSSSILLRVQCGRLDAMLCTRGYRTQQQCCSFIPPSYHTQLPTPGRIAKDRGDSNLEARGSAPRGRRTVAVLRYVVLLADDTAGARV